MNPLYYQGSPCKRGHTGIRRICNRSCVECEVILHQKKYLEKGASIREATSAYYYANHEREMARRAAYGEVWRPNNRETIKACVATWQKANPGVLRFYDSTKRSAKLKRTPAWADLEAIKKIYLDCPEGMHVDHIVPLRGKRVSGLHVEYNLQYLTPLQNSIKGNGYHA
jgi:hypothetical protein